MQRTLTIFALLAILLMAGCKTTDGGNKPAWGETYADVPVPANYEPHDNPPFKRQDSDSGKRIYGIYSYRSTGEALDDAAKVQKWFKEKLPDHGWELMVEELDTEKGTMSVRFEKKENQLLVTLSPDKKLQGKRFSVLVIEMNPKF